MTEQPGPRDTGSTGTTGTTGSTGTTGTTIVLGHVVTPTSQTSSQTPGPTHLDIPDGAVAYAGGTIQAVGAADDVRASYPDAYLVVLDAHADANSAVLKRRADNAVNTGELLFALMILGDERAVTRTVVAGDG